MRNPLTCIILGLGLAIICANAKAGASDESGWNLFVCKILSLFGNSCNNKAGSNDKIPKKSPFDSQVEKLQKNLNSNECLDNQKNEKNLYCSVMSSALNLWKPPGANDKYTETPLKDSVNFFENLFDNLSHWDNNIKKDFVTILPMIMEEISLGALLTALANPGTISQTVVQNFTVIQTNLINPESFEKNETLTLKAQGDQMAIHPRAVTVMTTDTVAVAFISYGGLKTLLDDTLLQNGTLLGNEMLTGVHMNSRLISNKVAKEEVLCVHLNSGALSNRGCQRLFSNITHTECSCQYLSSFAVLMATSHKHILCSVITGILKYLFLACFVWMFLEAVNLYLIVRNLKVANYSGASKYMKISMYLIGYGFPVLIVAISAAINPGAFGTLYHCWLSPDFIWSFMGPVCVIIVVNLVFFCLILKNLRNKLASLNSQISSVKNTSWLLQKVQVREAYWHWTCCVRESPPQVSEIVVTSIPISNPSTNIPSVTAVVDQKIEWGNTT
ncbi:hypothetical protein E2320_010117 [Naja naja]|nr:hypothetical protein E2320_010117 [Naja naja]